MKLKSVHFTHIKAFKTLDFSFEKTAVLIGQNDHGKSSILKAIDIILNQVDAKSLEDGALHPDLAERLLPIFPVDAKARRITLTYEKDDKKSLPNKIYITVRADLKFTISEKIEKNMKTSPNAVKILKEIQKHNRFVLIPALRDGSSAQFKELFSKMLREHGLLKMIPQKAGGTPKEYRKLREIRNNIMDTIKPYVDAALLPRIEDNFGFGTQHRLGLKFNVDVQNIGEWILDNIQLGFRLTEEDETTLALSEAGSGVQSGVLLALRRLEQGATENPDIQYILAIEEPEAFLHPQKQKELYQNIVSAQTANLRILLTTHSPYIISETPFSKLGLVKKVGSYSSLYAPILDSKRDAEILDSYSSDVNSSIFFADRLIFVEGESDQRVIKRLLQKKMGAKAHRISVISAAGNRNFSPYLKMMKAWQAASIPFLIVTDFDSLIAADQRPMFKGAADAGFTHQTRQSVYNAIDLAQDKSEEEFERAAIMAEDYFRSAKLNVFVFRSDLEFSLITENNKSLVAKILTDESSSENDYAQYSLHDLKKNIGSKGVPLNPLSNPKFKKPYIHQKIAETIDLRNADKDIGRLMEYIDSL